MPEPQGKQVEEWVKDFARKYHILSNKQFPADNLIKLVDTKLQRRFVAARSYVEKELPHSGDWIDLILNNKRLPKQASEQAIGSFSRKSS